MFAKSGDGLATSRKEFLPGEGLLVLEAQDKLLEFLVDCCRKILCDIPGEDLIGDTFPIQPEPELKFGVDVAGFASLAVMAEEAPYRPPAILDLGKLEELLEAKKHEIEDHLWALREDPAYFVQELKEAKEHRLEFVKEARGRLHPVANNLRDKIWGLSLVNILRYSHKSLELFSELHRQARDLRLLQQKYQGQISPAEDLPEKYSDALLVFRNFLNQAAKMPLNQLKEVVPGSPPMRKFFVREPFEDLRRTDHVVRDKNGKKTKSEENLLWLLRTLWEDGHTLLFARLPLVVDELERVLQTEPVADELVTAHVMKVIGDLSIVAQCFKQVDVYYPWAHGFDQAYYGKKDQIDAAFNKWNRQWKNAAGTTFTISGLEGAVKLAESTGGKFDYPYDKRRTRENTEALRRAEANLDSIWTEVDRAARFHEPQWHGTAVYSLLSQPRLLRRTADWVEPVKAKSASDVKANVQALERPLSNLFIGEGGTARPARPAPSKVKTKTRGTSSTVKDSTAPAEPEAGQSSDPDPQPTFHVDARALKVFRLLFFDPDATSTPGTISWTEFLHAMTATGFRVEKLYGSVWQFLPTKLDVERGIHFHEPHPKAKLAFEVARRYGRRLTRAYGWHGGMFVLKG
ncbi:hypothetical protein CPLU01_08838 [Colletotrichum plurivorum]|uniref:Uncharacterized protein n=1 Tax=Colletotrichum plurivorum TaxID=2175906 RepID=A0A8H6NBY1_9PEZI|nr:hypothetical protein CPLU01_08838 [Colletotrichum plurivorum]